MSEKSLSNAQKLLALYCRQRGIGDYQFSGDSKVIISTAKGKKQSITVNLFGDILDADTKKVIARGNVPHTLNGRMQFPTKWTDFGSDGRKNVFRSKPSIMARLTEAKAEVARREAVRSHGRQSQER